MEKKVDIIKFKVQCELCSCTNFYDLDGELCCVDCGYTQDELDLDKVKVVLENDIIIDFEDLD